LDLAALIPLPGWLALVGAAGRAWRRGVGHEPRAHLALGAGALLQATAVAVECGGLDGSTPRWLGWLLVGVGLVAASWRPAERRRTGLAVLEALTVASLATLVLQWSPGARVPDDVALSAVPVATALAWALAAAGPWRMWTVGALALILLGTTVEGVPGLTTAARPGAHVLTLVGAAALAVPAWSGELAPLPRRVLSPVALPFAQGALLLLALALLARRSVLGVPREPDAGVVAIGLVVVALLCRALLAERALALPAPSAAPAPAALRPEAAAADKLGALVEVSRVVAHGIRNSLSVLFSVASMLERDRPAAQRRELLRALGDEGDRMRTLVDQLTGFAGEGMLAVSEASCADLVREAVSRAASDPSWPRHVETTVETPPGGDTLRADWLRLESALCHLVSCAAAAGASRVSVREALTHRNGIEVVAVTIDGDSGPVDDDLVSGGGASLTASSFGGAPLWMAVARRAVRAHHGSLEVSRNAGGGLHVEIELPIVADPPEVG
jgi:signal transduction histidine kinase